MKTIHCEQNSLEWLRLRAGIPTASEFDNLITPEWKIRTGQMPQSYLARKLAEKWVGGPVADFQTIDMEIGKIQEEEAIPFFTFTTGIPVTRVGLITTDDGRIGCSPDGLLPDGCGLEIKCPGITTHVGYLLRGELPKDYAAQVHGSMFVTGFHQWKFMSYHRKLPPLILTIERDEEIQAQIGEALSKFIDRFDQEWARLVEMNGGEPTKRQDEQPESTPESELQEVTP